VTAAVVEVRVGGRDARERPVADSAVSPNCAMTTASGGGGRIATVPNIRRRVLFISVLPPHHGRAVYTNTNIPLPQYCWYYTVGSINDMIIVIRAACSARCIYKYM